MVLKRQIRFLFMAGTMLAAANGSAFAQQAGFPQAGFPQQPPPAPNDPTNPRNYQQTITPSLVDMGSGIDQGNTGPFVTLDDRQFAQIMTERTMQSQMDRFATLHSDSEAVQQLSRDLANSCMRIEKILNRVVARLDLKLPGGIDAKRKARLDRMATLTGAEFDRAYLIQTIRLQNRALTITEREADKGGVAGLRIWAGMTIPVLQSQLEAARHTLAASSMVSQQQ
jgi:predicted outer membrane protein